MKYIIRAGNRPRQGYYWTGSLIGGGSMTLSSALKFDTLANAESGKAKAERYFDAFGVRIVPLLSPAEAKRKAVATWIRDMLDMTDPTDGAWTREELAREADELWPLKGGVR